MTCRACSDRSRCRETFTCYACKETLNACRHRVGGIDSRLVPECVRCHELRVLGPAWASGWSPEKNPRGQQLERRVLAAQSHQERNT